MLEARRRSYMSAMGIVQYVPVAVIDGAKTSLHLQPEQVHPEQVSTELNETTNETINDEPAVVDDGQTVTAHATGNARPNVLSNEANPETQSAPATQVTAVVSETPAFDSSNPPPTPNIIITPLESSSPQVQGAAVPVERPLRFALTMVEIPGKLMVVADLGDADAMGCSALEYQLLQGILKSIALAAEPSPHLFRWPLVNNKHLAQGKTEAADGLQGFLIAKLEKLNVSNVLLIGEYASGFMPDQAVTASVDFSGKAVQCYRTPSLNQMLKDWQYKPVAWQALMQLMRALH